MNKLPDAKRKQILHMLVEGMSMRSISRVVGVSLNTVTKLLVDAGTACEKFHNERVTGLATELVECDEIWSFCYAKERQVPYIKGKPEHAGSVWTWTAMDTGARFIISWLVSGGRDTENALLFMADLRSRLARRVQLSTDGFHGYLVGVEGSFGGDVDYAQIIKEYGYKHVKSVEKKAITGSPDYYDASTIYMERHNLTTRMSVRRFTRMTNAFSKKIENHCHALALYFVYYNFCRIHSTLKTTPAVKIGLDDTERDLDWMLRLIDGPYERKTRGIYKKSRISN